MSNTATPQQKTGNSKILLLISLMLMSAIYGFAQGNGNPPGLQKWNTSGNNAIGTDFIGTTNNASLIFKTNNLQALEIDPAGDLFIKKLSGQGDGIIKHDQNGKIERIPFNNSFTQVLSSSGVWKEISTFTGLQVNNNDIIQTTTGYFGIGTSSPQAKLDVNGNATISGELKIGGNLTFAGNKVISYLPASNGNPEILSFGAGTPIPRPLNACIFPNVPLNIFSGLLQSGGYTSGGLPNLMSMGWDGANGIIDIAGANSDGIAPRLLVNYYCGKDVLVCTGPNGGNVVMTSTGKVQIGSQKIILAPHNDYKLSVDGKIVAKSMYVIAPANGWADFVFENDYKLSSLAEVEKYFKTYKHLPEIPSEKEILENGVNVAEMNKLLLQKVEELTIYMIEQQKQIEKSNAEIQKLKEVVGTGN